MKKAALLLIISLVIAACLFAQSGRSSFTIQPLGKVEASLIGIASQAIADVFSDLTVTVEAPQEMPAGAYYEPRKRYRAEKILEFLDRIVREKSVKVIGLTSVDISTAGSARVVGASWASTETWPFTWISVILTGP
mgnify:CR=1 FL=1